MTKEDIKKSILTGVVTGVVGAVTIFILFFSYLWYQDWYRDYKYRKAAENRELSYSHCLRPIDKDSVTIKEDSICSASR